MVSCETLQPDNLQCPYAGEMHCKGNNGLMIVNSRQFNCHNCDFANFLNFSGELMYFNTSKKFFKHVRNEICCPRFLFTENSHNRISYRQGAVALKTREERIPYTLQNSDPLPAPSPCRHKGRQNLSACRSHDVPFGPAPEANSKTLEEGDENLNCKLQCDELKTY